MTRKLSIIIPCYNEEKTVSAIVKRVLAVSFSGWGREVIVVNDGSTDGSAQALAEFSSGAFKPSDIHILNLEKNSGKGTAVREALKVATGDFVIIQDADLECQPEEIPLLLKVLEGLPAGEKVMVLGSRELGDANEKSKHLSRFGSLSITMLINLLYGSTLTDASMCYKLFPRSTFNFFNAGGFEAELLFVTRLLKEGYRIIEVPVTYKPRDTSEGKKIRYRDGIKILFKIFLSRFGF